MLTSCNGPSVMPINVGILPCRSSSVCTLTAALCLHNLAHGNSDRHRSIVVESKAYRLWSGLFGRSFDELITRLGAHPGRRGAVEDRRLHGARIAAEAFGELGG